MSWRVIPGFSRYSASHEGQVRRDVRMHNSLPGPVVQFPNRDGYLCVGIQDDDRRNRKMPVHILVALAFIGPRPEGLQVCHGPAGKLVNRASNLRYDTQGSNVEDARQHGTMAVGSKHPSSKLNERKVSEILCLLSLADLTHKQIGARFGVDGACVGRIGLGLTWRHVPRIVEIPNRYSASRKRVAPQTPDGANL